MTKRRIFIAMHYMELGGAESALLGLLQTLDYRRVDVDLFIHAHRGELMRLIPEEVNLLPESLPYSMIEEPITEAIRNGCWGVALGRCAARVRARLTNSPEGWTIGGVLAGRLPMMSAAHYDAAISFLTPHHYVGSLVKADRKLAWVHTDYGAIRVDARRELPVWDRFDYIVSISGKVTEGFLSVFPSLEEKMVEIPNILPEEAIREMAKAEIPVSERGGRVSRILSVGRFSHAKGFDEIPRHARRMKEAGALPFVWQIIGYGGDAGIIREAIRKEGVGDCVEILGKRANPYPYMAACDVYAQPSRFEGRCVCVQEARLLGKCVAVADYFTADAQIEDGVDGLIFPREEFGPRLAALLRDEATRRRIENTVAGRDYSDRDAVNRLYDIISA